MLEKETRLRAAVGAAALLLLGTSPGRADSMPQDRAIAQTLFDEGRRLMNESRLAEACAKFDESQRLDPSVGTQLNLAVCREKEGRLATAWEQFREVVTAAKRAGEPEREKYAGERAAALEPRLSRVTVAVPAGTQVRGLTVQIDGVALEQPAWGTSIPVDGGSHRIVASAPGRARWEITVEVSAENEVKTIDVPPLAQVQVLPPAAVAPLRGVPERMPSALRRLQTAGLVTMSAGAATAIVGGVFGVLAGEAIRQQGSDCASGADCPRHGAALQDHSTAVTDGTISDIAFVAAGVLGAGGLALFFAGMRGPHSVERGLTLEPSVALRGAGLRLATSF